MVTPYEYAQMSNDAYNINNATAFSLPNWQRIFSAGAFPANFTGFIPPELPPLPHGIVVSPDFLTSSGYFAAVYQNSVSKEIVIANKGTANWKDALADIELFCGSESVQYDSANIFTNNTISYIYSRPEFNDYTISVTGHSLGGFLAQLLQARYSELKECVVFDAPGAKDVIQTEFSDSYSRAQNAITNYVSQADFVNTASNQLDNIIRVYTEYNYTFIPQYDPKAIKINWHLNSEAYFISEFSFNDQHKITNIIKQFDPEQGYPYQHTSIKSGSWPSFNNHNLYKAYEALSDIVRNNYANIDQHPFYWENYMMLYYLFNQEDFRNEGKSYEDLRDIAKSFYPYSLSFDPDTSSQQGVNITVNQIPSGKLLKIWGTTNKNDIINANNGDYDTYNFAGDDMINTGSGVHNHHFFTPFGSDIINDRGDAINARLYINQLPIEGKIDKKPNGQDGQYRIIHSDNKHIWNVELHNTQGELDPSGNELHITDQKLTINGEIIVANFTNGMFGINLPREIVDHTINMGCDTAISFNFRNIYGNDNLLLAEYISSDSSKNDCMFIYNQNTHNATLLNSNKEHGGLEWGAGSTYRIQAYNDGFFYNNPLNIGGYDAQGNSFISKLYNFHSGNGLLPFMIRNNQIILFLSSSDGYNVASIGVDKNLNIGSTQTLEHSLIGASDCYPVAQTSLVCYFTSSGIKDSIWFGNFANNQITTNCEVSLSNSVLGNLTYLNPDFSYFSNSITFYAPYISGNNLIVSAQTININSCSYTMPVTVLNVAKAADYSVSGISSDENGQTAFYWIGQNTKPFSTKFGNYVTAELMGQFCSASSVVGSNFRIDSDSYPFLFSDTSGYMKYSYSAVMDNNNLYVMWPSLIIDQANNVELNIYGRVISSHNTGKVFQINKDSLCTSYDCSEPFYLAVTKSFSDQIYFYWQTNSDYKVHYANVADVIHNIPKNTVAMSKTVSLAFTDSNNVINNEAGNSLLIGETGKNIFKINYFNNFDSIIANFNETSNQDHVDISAFADQYPSYAALFSVITKSITNLAKYSFSDVNITGFVPIANNPSNDTGSTTLNLTIPNFGNVSLLVNNSGNFYLPTPEQFVNSKTYDWKVTFSESQILQILGVKNLSADHFIGFHSVPSPTSQPSSAPTPQPSTGPTPQPSTGPMPQPSPNPSPEPSPSPSANSSDTGGGHVSSTTIGIIVGSVGTVSLFALSYYVYKKHPEFCSKWLQHGHDAEMSVNGAGGYAGLADDSNA